ncbi:Splicing factor spf30 [Madurella mycetomatis]|uniref:Splicing factor spf30 n=1 Tax=Madurella mycetomatis TaxID=100816 RepID=A0A175VUY7_9PEZI|nr:Splicing factor spf30 [Madurella mycetomatis]
MSAQLEGERKECESQLELVNVSLADDPDNAELLGLKSELEQMIRLIDDSIAELKPKNEPTKAPPKKAPSPPPAEQKWSRENHPAFKKAAPAEEKDKEPEVIVYQVNDNVMAKWVSGDKGFYPARITSVTGSSTAPIYTVKFKSYDTVETLRAKDIRPVAQKRKADGTAVSSSSSAVGGAAASPAVPSPSSLTPTSTNNGIVLSAAADMYPQAQAANKAAIENNDEKPRPKFKKIKATKELEAGKNKWQEFNAKGKIGKAAKKESMFRTPEGVRGRVGFTGSGQAMRKDPTRTRHVYQPNEDLD